MVADSTQFPDARLQGAEVGWDRISASSQGDFMPRIDAMDPDEVRESVELHHARLGGLGTESGTEP